MKKLVAVCAAFCALTLPAIAADISVSPLGTYPPPRPVYSWTGCRIGANIGGGSARTSWNDPFGTVPNGGPGYLGDHTASVAGSSAATIRSAGSCSELGAPTISPA